MPVRKTYEAPELRRLGTVRELTLNCRMTNSDVNGGNPGTACKPLS